MTEAVSLPPGVVVKKRERGGSSLQGVPFGAGRPVTPAATDKPYLARSEIARMGRPAIYSTPEELFHCCIEYFQWADENPMYEQKSSLNKFGKWETHNIPKVRPYTQAAMCYYLGIHVDTWHDLRKREGFREIVMEIDNVVREQKFAGAAAGFFNPVIIARDLGLVDKQEVTGANGGPVEKITTTMTAAEAAEAYARTREAGNS
jgi:hypothetical protein